MVWRIGPVEKANLGDLVDLLMKKDLGYPDYFKWVHKSIAELENGRKQAIVAYNNGVYLGHCIFQKHPTIQKVGEIKNLRVKKLAFGQGLGEFLLKQAEFTLRTYVNTIMADVRSDQFHVINLLKKQDYKGIPILNLYDDGKTDIAYTKSIRSKKQLH